VVVSNAGGFKREIVESCVGVCVRVCVCVYILGVDDFVLEFLDTWRIEWSQ
jgi:hypothetical protein